MPPNPQLDAQMDLKVHKTIPTKAIVQESSPTI
jgi:hypothetical protein